MSLETAPEHDFRPSAEIFLRMRDEFRQSVVARALKHRAGAKSAVGKQFNASLRRLQADGYRDTSKAPLQKLQPLVLEALESGDEGLASSVLATWMASMDPLREAVTAHLTASGIPVPEPSDAMFESFWSFHECRDERDALTGSDDSLDEDEVVLMLCLVSQRFPSPQPLDSPTFCEMRNQLLDMPPDAPDWDEALAFTKWVLDILLKKRDELLAQSSDKIAEQCAQLQERFPEELQYLGVDPEPWPGRIEDRPAMIPSTLELLEGLSGDLEAYQIIFSRAPTREEEQERSVERREREQEILRLVKEWNEDLSRPDPEEENPETPAAVGAVNTEAFDALQGEHDQLQAEHQQARDEIGRLQAEIASLREQGESLRKDKEQMAAEKEHRVGEIDRLRGELTQSQHMEEQWRRSYVEEAKKQPGAEADDDDPGGIESVEEAIARAEKAFPEKLVIKLNSKSRRDTPFEKPGEVFDALAWLATAFGNGAPERIREAFPGWFYKPNQSDMTMGQYREWYRTQFDGRTWKLENHIGKGTRHDPRHTIRIAFAWDEARSRVVVGFIGTHQRNRQT